MKRTRPAPTGPRIFFIGALVLLAIVVHIALPFLIPITVVAVWMFLRRTRPYTAPPATQDRPGTVAYQLGARR